MWPLLFALGTVSSSYRLVPGVLSTTCAKEAKERSLACVADVLN
jgi:hypothetical protein